MTTMVGDTAAPVTKGRVMRSSARYYDLLVWLLTLGRERAFRERLIELARLRPGEWVLDVGCGTGTLAIAAKRRVGPAGNVHGIDASPEMIAAQVARRRKRASMSPFAPRKSRRFRSHIVSSMPSSAP